MVDDWIIPPKDPIMMFKGIAHLIMLLQEENNIIMGIIFCILINKNKLKRDNFIPISGVHRWRGAIPLFNIKARGGTKALIKKVSLKKTVWTLIENKKIKDPTDWIKKYFIHLSVELKVFVSKIKKIKVNRFISIPIQIDIHELEDRENLTDRIYIGKMIK